MGNNSAEDTSNITGHEGDGKLLGLGILILGLGKDFFVEELTDFLEGNKLHDGIRDLS